MMKMLYEVLKTAKMGAGKAPDLYTALLAKNLRRDGEVKTLSGIPPLTFRSNGQSLLDYLISGNTVQSGTPTPDNPIMPQGTGERTGNLADVIRGKVPRASDGSLVTFEGLTTEYVPFHTGDILSITFEKPVQTKRFYVFYYSGDTLLNTKDLVYGTSISSYGVSEAVDRIRIRIDYSGVEVSNVMLNTGSTALPYEPYGYKIPISSAGQTTPVYLGEVQTTRKIKKLVLTGEESTWRITGTGRMALPLVVSNTPNRGQICYCTHYKGTSIQSYGQLSDGECTTSTMDTIDNELGIYDSNYTTVADFKAYLAQQYAAGTPVTVWYVLAEPTTGIVDEPLRKIGEYADTVSMEQTGIEIPTVRGANTLDVLTDVKPSEVYIKYKE